jgi:hypothetical protein
MSINYSEELKKLQEFTGDYWKPKAGQYKVIALREMEDSEPFLDDKKNEPQLRCQLKIAVDGKEYLWNFPKGKTPASTYGQLVKLASVKGNKLAEQGFTVVVVGEGQNVRFTIVA